MKKLNQQSLPGKKVAFNKKPIFRITGIPQLADASLRKLIAIGAVSWNGEKPKLSPPLQLSACDTPVSRKVLESRN